MSPGRQEGRSGASAVTAGMPVSHSGIASLEDSGKNRPELGSCSKKPFFPARRFPSAGGQADAPARSRRVSNRF